MRDPIFFDTGIRRPWTATASIAVLALALGACGTGQQLAAGPVVGYVRERGWSAGWEAGGGPITTLEAGGDPTPDLPSLITHFSLGMSWRPGAPGSAEREQLIYAAWEPWLLLGGTFGVAHSSADRDLHFLSGVWEVIPWVVGAPVRSSSPLRRCSPCYTLSLAIGWRWSTGSEFYLAPKVGILNDVAMPYPFQTYAD